MAGRRQVRRLERALLLRALGICAERCLEGSGVDLDWYTTRARDYAEVLPWDHLDAGWIVSRPGRTGRTRWTRWRSTTAAGPLLRLRGLSAAGHHHSDWPDWPQAPSADARRRSVHRDLNRPSCRRRPHPARAAPAAGAMAGSSTPSAAVPASPAIVISDGIRAGAASGRGAHGVLLRILAAPADLGPNASPTGAASEAEYLEIGLAAACDRTKCELPSTQPYRPAWTLSRRLWFGPGRWRRS